MSGAVHEHDRKPDSGLLTTVSQCRAPIEWGSTKQKSVVASRSTEVELIGLPDKTDSMLLLGSRMKFLSMPAMGPAETFQDNTSTVALSYMGRVSREPGVMPTESDVHRCLDFYSCRTIVRLSLCVE